MEIKSTDTIIEFFESYKYTNMLSVIVDNAITLLANIGKAYIDSKVPGNENKHRMDIVNELIKKGIDKNIASLYCEIFCIMTENKEFFELPEDLQVALIDAIADNGHIFKKCDFVNNPYLKNIKIENNPILRTRKIRPLELFLYNSNVKCDDIIIPSIGMFEEDDFEFPELVLNDKVVSRVSPYEIKVMEDSINKASGNVLVCGLGLGYFSYMVSEKNNVNKVTIVEPSKENIDWFKETILPQFNHPEKIEIINIDTKSYIKELKDDMYNYVFIDISKEIKLLDNYFIIKAFTSKLVNTVVDIFEEDKLIDGIQLLTISLIDEYEWNSTHDKDEQIAFLSADTFFNMFISHIKNKLENANFEEVKDIQNFIKIENLLN